MGFRHIKVLRISTIRVKISMLAICLVTVSALAVVMVFLSGMTAFRTELEAEQIRQTRSEVESLAMAMYKLCESMHQASMIQRKHALTIMQQLMEKQGPPSLDNERVSLDTLTPSGVPGRESLPRLLLGGRPLALNSSADIPTPVVDEMMRLTGYHASIMLRMNPEGDFVRVATSVIRDGKRQIGVTLPAVDADGTPNPFARSILRGETAVGRTYVGDYVFVSTALPLKDAQGNIIGLYGPGIRQDLMENLRQVFMNTPVGRSGYFFILGVKGRQRGRYILSRNGERDGENVWDVKTGEGDFPVREVFRRAETHPPGQIFWYDYSWKNPGETVERKKFAAMIYFKPWDWLVGASAYETDFNETSLRLGNSLEVIIYRVLAAAFLVMAISVLVCWLLGQRITRPLNRAVAFAVAISQGKFPPPLAVTSTDETGHLAETLNTMAGQLENSMTELDRLRSYLSSIIASMPSALIVVDQSYAITLWNRMAEEITGIAAEKARGRQLFDLVPRLSAQRDMIARAIEMESVQQQTKYPFDQGRRYEDITVYPLKASEVEGAVIRLDDVTRQVKMAEAVIQSEKMMSVGGLAAGMAHEINNPLAGMIQGAQVVARRFDPEIKKNRAVAEALGISMDSLGRYVEERGINTLLTSVRRAGNRAARIVENMLTFSRKSTDAFELHDLNYLLDKTLELAENDYDLKKRFDFRQIKIVRRYADDLPPVPCDLSKVQQVFFNILKNGAEAMSSKTGACDPKSCFTIATWQEEDMACVSIRDNGPGMDAATRKRVFEPFFTTKGVGRGTGLGLSVSFFIITEDHGGHMSVSGSQGDGTQFVIKLPFSRG